MLAPGVRLLPAVLLVLVVAPAACEGTGRGGDSDTDSDVDADTDTDVDADVDTDTDSDTAVQESVIVDLMTTISAPADGFTTIGLRDHDDILFDMALANAAAKVEILESMRDLGHPLYFEIVPATRVIVDYLFPIESEVANLTPEDDEVLVALMRSAAVHALKRDNPDFDSFLALLEDSLETGAMLLVTDDDLGHAIVDVRPALDP